MCAIHCRLYDREPGSNPGDATTDTDIQFKSRSNRGGLRPFRVRRRTGFLGCGYQAAFNLESLLRGLHPAFDNILSRAPGTILSRAYWLTDTITFGEMLL